MTAADLFGETTRKAFEALQLRGQCVGIEHFNLRSRDVDGQAFGVREKDIANDAQVGTASAAGSG